MSAPVTAPAITAITVFACEPDEALAFREVAHRIGMTLRVTEEPLDAANVALASGHRCVSVGHKSRIANSTLRALAGVGVRHISTRSIGFDHLDLAYAASVGISVANVTYSPDSVADYTLMLILMALRDAKAIIRRTDLHDYRLADRRGRELRDLTVGVVGTGRIGTAVIGRLEAFGCRVLTHDRRPDASAEWMPLDDLLRRCDLVTLHLPLGPETHHLLDRRRIAGMKRGAYLVNTGRGALVDTEALVAALESGALSGAALDVVEGEEGVFYADRRREPLESPLLRRLQEMPNAIVSPHTAYFTDRALADMVESSILDCLRFEGGSRHE
ncbi:MAG: lactate dehydrogenase [Actinobacteria bacterium]|nr:lactate dehydrogenase [Actinomycetota bacterium]